MLASSSDSYYWLQDVLAIVLIFGGIAGAARYGFKWADKRQTTRLATAVNLVIGPKLDAVGEHLKRQDAATEAVQRIVSNGLSHHAEAVDLTLNGAPGHPEDGLVAQVEHHGQILKSLDPYPGQPGSGGALLLKIADKLGVENDNERRD